MLEEKNPDRTHNMKEMTSDLKMAADRILEIERKKAELSEQIAQVKRDHVKKHMPVRDFNTVYKLYKLEREIEDNPEQAVNDAIDNIRMAFEALKPGGQGSLFQEPDETKVGHDPIGDFNEQDAA